MSSQFRDFSVFVPFCGFAVPTFCVRASPAHPRKRSYYHTIPYCSTAKCNVECVHIEICIRLPSSRAWPVSLILDRVWRRRGGVGAAAASG
eukprot:3319171-Pleurochrysis_carterae.AAC.2